MTLPADLRAPTPLRAVPSATIGTGLDAVVAELTRRGWLFDVKWDGIRALAVIDGGRIRLRSRDGADITAQYPDVTAALVAAGLPANLVLDGELVCLDDAGRPSHERIQLRHAQTSRRRVAEAARTRPATFITFDLLWNNGDRRGAALHRRHAELATLAAQCGLVPSPTDRDGAAMLVAARELGLEGLVAKDPDSAYRAGDDPSWVKIKFLRSLTALVTGTTPGEGSRAATFGALNLALLDPAGKPTPIGTVGSGFTRAALLEAHARLAAGDTVLVEVSYQDLTRRGRLRGAVYRGMRHDLPPGDCTTDQLTQ